MINDAGIKLEEHYESINDGDLTEVGLQPKMDPVGIWTEGWGHAIVDDKGNFVKGLANKALAYRLSKIHTVQQADVYLQMDNRNAELIVHRNVTVPITENMYAALTCHTMNSGGSHTLFSLINQKANPADIFNWWCAHYITGQGNPKPLPGLQYRRMSEALLGLRDMTLYFTKNNYPFKF